MATDDDDADGRRSGNYCGYERGRTLGFSVEEKGESVEVYRMEKPPIGDPVPILQAIYQSKQAFGDDMRKALEKARRQVTDETECLFVTHALTAQGEARNKADLEEGIAALEAAGIVTQRISDKRYRITIDPERLNLHKDVIDLYEGCTASYAILEKQIAFWARQHKDTATETVMLPRAYCGLIDTTWTPAPPSWAQLLDSPVPFCQK